MNSSAIRAESRKLLLKLNDELVRWIINKMLLAFFIQFVCACGRKTRPFNFLDVDSICCLRNIFTPQRWILLVLYRNVYLSLKAEFMYQELFYVHFLFCRRNKALWHCLRIASFNIENWFPFPIIGWKKFEIGSIFWCQEGLFAFLITNFLLSSLHHEHAWFELFLLVFRLPIKA